MPLLDLIEQAYAAMSREPVLWSAVVTLGALAIAVLVHYVAQTLNAGRFGWQRRLRVLMGVAPQKRIGELFWLLVTLHLVLWPVLLSVVLRIWGLHDEAKDLLHAPVSYTHLTLPTKA